MNCNANPETTLKLHHILMGMALTDEGQTLAEIKDEVFRRRPTLPPDVVRKIRHAHTKGLRGCGAADVMVKEGRHHLKKGPRWGDVICMTFEKADATDLSEFEIPEIVL